MKILFINYEYPPVGGGGGVGTSQLAEELAKYHDVDVITSSFKGLKRYEIQNGVNIYRVPILNRKEKDTATTISMISFLPFSVLKGIKLILKKRYDVINTHFAIPSGPTGIILSKLFGIAHVLTIIGGDIYDPSKKLSPHNNKILRKIVKNVMKKSDRIVAISSDTKNRGLKFYNNKLEIDVVHYGLVAPSYKNIDRNELGLNNTDFVIISIARLVKRKGFQYLIQAISKIENKNIKLLVIGDGPERNNLIKLSKEMGIGSKVSFIGPIWGEKKYQFLSISDLFVLPSLHEGFGIVFLEAMHCGLSIVATNNGGQTDFLVDGRNALLVPIKDSYALAEKIIELVEDKVIRSEMSSANRKDVQNFYIEKIAQKYMKIYEEVTAEVRE